MVIFHSDLKSNAMDARRDLRCLPEVGPRPTFGAGVELVTCQGPAAKSARFGNFHQVVRDLEGRHSATLTTTTIPIPIGFRC